MDKKLFHIIDKQLLNLVDDILAYLNVNDKNFEDEDIQKALKWFDINIIELIKEEAEQF